MIILILIVTIIVLIVIIINETSNKSPPADCISNTDDLTETIKSMYREYVYLLVQYTLVHNRVKWFNRSVTIDAQSINDNLPEYSPDLNFKVPRNLTKDKYINYASQYTDNENEAWLDYLEKSRSNVENRSPSGYYEYNGEQLIPFPVTGVFTEAEFDKNELIKISNKNYDLFLIKFNKISGNPYDIDKETFLEELKTKEERLNQ